MSKFDKPENCSICPYQWEGVKHLPIKEQNLINDNCLVINFKKGESICKQGTQVSHAFYVAKGIVKLYIEGKNKSLILNFVTSGNYIGMQSIFGNEVYRFSVNAIENSMICMLNKETILDVAKRNIDYLYKVTDAISIDSNYVYKRLIDLNQKQLKGRIADSLIYLANDFYKSDKFELTITRKELAEFSSMTMENAVRVLSDLKKEGILIINGRSIEIINKPLLYKISEIG